MTRASDSGLLPPLLTGHLALPTPDIHFQSTGIRLMEDALITRRHRTHIEAHAYNICSIHHRISFRSLHRVAYHDMPLRLHRLDHCLLGCSVRIRFVPPQASPAHRRHMPLTSLDADPLRDGGRQGCMAAFDPGVSALTREEAGL